MPVDETPTPTPNEPDSGAGANDISETYELETLEQLRAIADELRTRIVEALSHRAMTVTQLGEMLGEAPAKIHYHVRELEKDKVKLIRLVATREKSGILEKYYRAVARNFTVAKTLLLTAPSDETLATMRAYLDTVSQGFLRATEYTVRNQLWENPKDWGLNTSQVWVTFDEMKELAKRVQAEFDRFATPRGIEGEEERTFVMMGYDPRIAEQSSVEPMSKLAPETPPPAHTFSLQPPDAPPPPKNPPPPRKVQARTRARHMVVAGAYSLRRSYLEEIIAENRQLDISAIGVFTVADDITPELVEQAISHFRHRGVLNASPAVREALKRKE